VTAQALLFAVWQLQPSLNKAEARDIAEACDSAAKLTDVDPALLLALAFAESSLDRYAVNRKTGAVGLFQIAPVHLVGVSPMRTSDAEWSARTGAKLLRAAIDRTGSVEKGLARFNGRTCRSCKWTRQVLALAANIRRQWAQERAA
jgi:soluble lytic murein transglycosylase-like protein